MNFYDKYLNDIQDAFLSNKMCIIECLEKSTGDTVKVLAAVRVNEFTQELGFLPIAILYDKNPMMNLVLDEQNIIASQKSLDEWAEDSNKIVVDLKALN